MNGKPRRLVVLDALGSVAGSIDLTGVPNADSRTPMMLEIQEQCDLGHWHKQERIPAPLWGSDR